MPNFMPAAPAPPTGSGEPTNEVAELAKVADLEDTVAVGRVRGDDRVRRVPLPPPLRIQPVHPARAFLDRAKRVQPRAAGVVARLAGAEDRGPRAQGAASVDVPERAD